MLLTWWRQTWGIAFAPRPLLRSINNKSTAHRDYADGQPTSIALVWLKDKDSDAIQDFVGIAKGRTANTSRQAVPKRTAKEKAAAKKSSAGEQPAEGRSPCASEGASISDALGDGVLEVVFTHKDEDYSRHQRQRHQHQEYWGEGIVVGIVNGQA